MHICLLHPVLERLETSNFGSFLEDFVAIKLHILGHLFRQFWKFLWKVLVLSKDTITRSSFLAILERFFFFWKIFGLSKDTHTRSSFLAILGVFTEDFSAK